MLPGLAAALAAVALGSPASASAQPCPPAASAPLSQPQPTAALLTPQAEQVLACAGAQPVTGAVFAHWATVAEKAEGSGHQPPSSATVIQQVMGFLISGDWVLGEAQKLKVVVSVRAVRRMFDRLRASEFHKPREFRAFLRTSGETVADVLFRVRLNLVSSRLQQHVVAGHRSARSKEQALLRFVSGFRSRWQAQTYCAAQYAVMDCGHTF